MRTIKAPKGLKGRNLYDWLIEDNKKNAVRIANKVLKFLDHGENLSQAKKLVGKRFRVGEVAVARALYLTGHKVLLSGHELSRFEKGRKPNSPKEVVPVLTFEEMVKAYPLDAQARLLLRGFQLEVEFRDNLIQSLGDDLNGKNEEIKSLTEQVGKLSKENVHLANKLEPLEAVHEATPLL